MSKIKIVIIDAASGHTVETLTRDFGDATATDAAEEIRDAIDMHTDSEDE